RRAHDMVVEGMSTQSPPPRRLSILGATGSIGTSTLDVLAQHPGAFEVEALVANRNLAALAKAAQGCRARVAVTADPALYRELKSLLAGTGTECGAGPEAVLEAASRPADLVMAAIVGADGLEPTLAAARQGSTIALANKECLVSGGEVFTGTA